MKHIFILLLLSAFVLTSNAQEGTIKFSIKNAPSDSCIIAYYLYGKQYVISVENSDPVENKIMVLDKKGQGTFYNKDMKTGVYLLAFQPSMDYVEFLYEEKSMSLSFDFNAIYTSMKTDSKANELFSQRTAFVESLAKRKETLEEQFKKDPVFNVEGAIDDLEDEFKAFNKKMIADNPNNIAAKFFNGLEDPIVPESITDQNERFYYYRSHFFDNIDFQAPWIIRTPYFDKKVKQYTEKLTSADPDSLIVAWDYLISKAKGNDEVYKLLVIEATNYYATSKLMGYDFIYLHFVDNYYLTGLAPWADEETLDKMRIGTSKLRNNLIGHAATDFKITTSDLKPSSLYRTNSEYTILFFAQNDCGHCESVEEELMELKAIIPANVKILEIYFGDDGNDGLKNKKEKGFYWEVGAVMDKSDFLKLTEHYNLLSLPKIFLLDKDKKILAKGLDIKQTIDYQRQLAIQ